MNKIADQTISELDILPRAVQAVERETGLRLEVTHMETGPYEKGYDAVIRLQPGNITLLAEVKRWAQHSNLGALIHQIKQLPQPGLLAADYVNPKMAEKLRQQGVQFIDTVGNAYINQPPVFVYVTANRQATLKGAVIKAETNRAFEPTGLKVIFAFLCDPNLVNAPYREIAEKAGVALGTVGVVINGLKAANLIIDKGKGRGRVIAHYRKLLDRWTEAWPEKLKPKYLVGEFVADTPEWWKNIDIGDYGGYWGGEIAAAEYTHYLTPTVATLYLPEAERDRLFGEARLRRGTHWPSQKNVLIYRPFWPEAFADIYTDGKALVHPVLVYADLIATGEPRNFETARRLYDEHIARYHGED